MPGNRVAALELHLVEDVEPEHQRCQEARSLGDAAQLGRPDADVEPPTIAIAELRAVMRESTEQWRQACVRLEELFELLSTYCVLLAQKEDAPKT